MDRNRKKNKRKVIVERNHLAILRSAMDVFSEYGYHDARLDLIAARANLSKGAIYTHFESKQDLFISVIEWGEHQLFHQIHEARKRCTSVLDMIESSLRTYFRFYEKRESFFRVLVKEKINFEDSAQERIRNMFRDFTYELESIIRVGIEEGVIRSIDSHICAVMLTGLANSLFFNWLHSGSDKKIIDLYHEAVSFIRHGIFVGNENTELC